MPCKSYFTGLLLCMRMVRHSKRSISLLSDKHKKLPQSSSKFPFFSKGRATSSYSEFCFINSTQILYWILPNTFLLQKYKDKKKMKSQNSKRLQWNTGILGMGQGLLNGNKYVCIYLKCKELYCILWNDTKNFLKLYSWLLLRET